MRLLITEGGEILEPVLEASCLLLQTPQVTLQIRVPLLDLLSKLAQAILQPAVDALHRLDPGRLI
jgi:hypothetical protein